MIPSFRSNPFAHMKFVWEKNEIPVFDIFSIEPSATGQSYFIIIEAIHIWVINSPPLTKPSTQYQTLTNLMSTCDERVSAGQGLLNVITYSPTGAL